MAGTDYVVNPLDATSPLDTNVARKGAAEFRALKASVNARLAAILPPAINEIPVRQTVLGGPITAAGVPSMLAIGAGLNVDLKATAVAVTMAFAGGFSVLGATDYVEQYVADVASYWPALPAGNTSYLTSTRTGAGVTVAGQTLVPPQYGDTFDQTASSLMHFEGANASVAMIDAFGNTWTPAGNAQISTAQFKVGTSSLALDGAGDWITSTNFTSVGTGSWTREFYVRFSALPTAGNNAFLYSNTNAGNFGAYFNLNNAAGTIKLALAMSSTGAANDIVNALGIKTAWVINTWYHIALVYDALAGKYFTYVDGVLDQTVVSTARICATTQTRLGAYTGATQEMAGWIDEYRASPCCRYPNGVAFVPSVVAYTMDGDWFDKSQMLMKTPLAESAVAGTNPTFTTVNKLYVGEGDTSAAAVIAVRTYAYQGKYTSDDFVTAASTLYSKACNLGIIPKIIRTALVCQTNNGYGYLSGSVLWMESIYDTTSTRGGIPYMTDRNTLKYITGTNVWAAQNGATGAAQGLSFTDFKTRLEVQRGW